ncbi:glutamate synthase (NADPH), homotetrameric [Flavonifractor sp. An92]|uniref:NADPH-dependent glutamate synthase n=1 Tax=Flavonifractor sp. An92 TaxID=1965666 RepID=UPI000B3AB2A5|nr:MULTISPECIES: NADPH-dependent glutamate synthase [unclassified Flavonifractor]OUN07838.1 glutamate synthase (NADPH), homotetrameric [Flavonifractor sp. An92]OUQ22548.1 glutamate synthase (NADPH), homotetrameric [Flavonifractor sp. An135]
MPNMSMTKNPMPEQDPNVRNHNFKEVAIGYTAEMAMDEAKRCLGCKNKPCVKGCPVNIRIPEFIAKVAEGDFQAAYEIITDTNALPSISGRVCPQETQCECHCVRGIKGEPVAIGRLERFVADWYRENVNAMPKKPESNGIKVAVVGSGPASLTCASDLAKKGYQVSIFEAFHTAGGVLVYGIPEFRLPKAIVQNEVDKLAALGADVETDVVVGRTYTIDEMFEDGYKAVFVGSGAGLPMFMGIPGEALAGVYSANEYLTRINLMKAYKEGYDTPIKDSKAVAVVGGGNVAMDAARCAKRMGAKVYVVYRRDEEAMPARREEIHHAKEEGIEFLFLNNPVKILDDGHGKVRAMECVKMELGEPDASGRRRPSEVPGSNYELEVDTVIMSLGTSPNPLIRSTTPGLDANQRGCLIADEETMATSREGVYAGGDAVTGAATVILAMGAGKKAAVAMDKYLQEKYGNQ